MRRHLHVSGIVQGVGFRPFVHNTACRLGLGGWVKNSTDGVHIEAEGDPEVLDAFIAALRDEKPASAVIEDITVHCVPQAQSEAGFSILDSDAPSNALPCISPDLAVCPECLREIADSGDRRFRYPFTNCTNCGPRYTIVRAAPYDRHLTSMQPFTMCRDCQSEYEDPENRRFHAQPNACPVCGPAYSLTDFRGNPVPLAAGQDVFDAARSLVAAGHILAVQGIGGFHLACDAAREDAVAGLRRRKVREDKPFAVMAGSVDSVRRLCCLSAAEAELLAGPVRPVLLLDKSAGYDLAESVAPRNPRVGMMLPYTPAHALLVRPEDVWVMTSGNRSDEPIAYRPEDAYARLSGIADHFLVHNREIFRRADDSVVRMVRDIPYPFRRSRGYAPLPVRLSGPSIPLLACGGELKSTFCLVRDGQAFVSAHIGDLENLSTYEYFTESIRHYEDLFHIRPRAVAHDLHPEYLSTRHACSLDLPCVGVQHHHAHIAAVLAEQGLDEPVLGAAFDGTGYGTDGTIWGGEFLIADRRDFVRAAHCRVLPLPGAERAIREPWRMAAMILAELYGEQAMEAARPSGAVWPPDWAAAVRAARRGVNSPLTSSAGRLFDAAAALLSVRQAVNYEGQAAVELELAAGTARGNVLPYRIVDGTVRQLDLLPAFDAIVNSRRRNVAVGALAADFHTTFAHAAADMLQRLGNDSGIRKVALSGGVFQNLRLLGELTGLLEARGFLVYRHRLVPPNDGGLSLGQAAVAARICAEKGV